MKRHTAHARPLKTHARNHIESWAFSCYSTKYHLEPLKIPKIRCFNVVRFNGSRFNYIFILYIMFSKKKYKIVFIFRFMYQRLICLEPLNLEPFPEISPIYSYFQRFNIGSTLFVL